MNDYETLVDWTVYHSQEGREASKRIFVGLLLLLIGVTGLCFWIFDPASALIVGFIFFVAFTAQSKGLKWGTEGMRSKLMKPAFRQGGLSETGTRNVTFELSEKGNVKIEQDGREMYIGPASELELFLHCGRVITRSADCKFFSVFPEDRIYLEHMKSLGAKIEPVAGNVANAP